MTEPISKQRVQAILVEAKRGWANVSDVEIEAMATELLALREPKAWKHAGRPTADETVAMARRYLDNANREAARMAAGVVLMHEELGKLRKRCPGAEAPRSARAVLYVSHPLAATDAEIRAIGVPSDGATEYTLREFAVKENIERARRWLMWLRGAFQETTFIAPWIANILAYGDDAYIAAFERGGVDACAIIDRCDGIVLCGARISDDMRREAEHGFARDPELPSFQAWNLTCAASPEPPADMRPTRPFAAFASVYRYKEPTLHDNREPTP